MLIEVRFDFSFDFAQRHLVCRGIGSPLAPGVHGIPRRALIFAGVGIVSMLAKAVADFYLLVPNGAEQADHEILDEGRSFRNRTPAWSSETQRQTMT